MINELEALVAHVYIVGGRAVGSTPPGALAVAAPKRAPRPRQEETLFLLLVPSGAVKAPASVYQTLAEQAADTYFKTTGSITSGLRETLIQLNLAVIEQQKNLMQPFQISAMGAVMHEEEIYLARCGTMLAIYRQEKQVSIFPADRSSISLNMSPPLGAGTDPRVELNHYELNPDSLLIMADQGLMNVPEDKLKATVLAVNEIGEMLEPLRQLMDVLLAHATVIQFVTEDTPTPPIPSLKLAPPKLPPPAPKPAETAVAIVPVHEPEIDPQSTVPLTIVAKPTARFLSRTANFIGGLGERVFPGDPGDEAPRRIPWLSNLIVLFAMLIPLVIAVIVISLALSEAGTTDFEVCRVDVLQRHDVTAQLTQDLGQAPNPDRLAQAREQWLLVREEALECEAQKPGDIEMRQIAGEAQNNLDRFDRVTRLAVTALRQFGDNAELRGPVSGNWIQLYTLDRTHDEVYQDSLNIMDGSLVAVGEAPVIFKGQNIRGSVVEDLVDIEWLEQGGLGSGSNVPIALDENGLLVWYSETLRQPDALQLVLPAIWSRPVALAMWRVNLYILDRGAQQVWRYVPVNGVYAELPAEYFAGEVRPDLSEAVDLGIDDDGSLYILFADGTIKKFRGGEEVEFTLFNLPIGALTSGSSLLVDNNPVILSLAVTDVENETLYTLSFGGTVNRGYRPLNQLNAFENISGVLINPDLSIMYILAGNILYSMAR